MSTEKILEEFEAAYSRGDFYAVEQDSEIKFQDFRKHCAYVAFKTGWQASRAAIEVDLPEEFPEDGHGPMVMMSHHVRTAIESLGLKVKGG